MDEPGEATGEPTSEPARDYAAEGPGADGGGAFDAGVFALLLAVLVFVSVTNLWLRWRAQGEAFLPALRRRLGALRGRRPPGS